MASSATAEPAKKLDPVEDTVPKVNDEIAVGADLEFQRKWWRFERVMWVLFTLIVVLDLLGAFGRGYLAKGQVRAPGGAIEVKYERIARFRTPSIMTVHLSGPAIHDGKAQLWVSESMIRPLGTQRVIPQPVESRLDEHGVLYTFPAGSNSCSIEFALEPSQTGIYDFSLRAPGGAAVQAKTVVLP
jgi:hypothetical protein